MKVARRTTGPVYANLQGRKPREVWRGLASDAMGDFDAGGVLPRCVECLFGRRPMKRRARSAGRDMRHRGRAAVIERHDGCRGWREGEHGHCWSRAGEADGQYIILPRTDLDHDVSILITAVEVAGR